MHQGRQRTGEEINIGTSSMLTRHSHTVSSQSGALNTNVRKTAKKLHVKHGRFVKEDSPKFAQSLLPSVKSYDVYLVFRRRHGQTRSVDSNFKVLPFLGKADSVFNPILPILTDHWIVLVSRRVIVVDRDYEIDEKTRTN
ncbi:hypothetical protein J6590_072621 [Homalodisca vitripennis]|nr:hypothetical protein J6590_072621 [Homalodisca vitripennis]